MFREEQKALPPPHPVGTTSDRAIRRGLASTHTHMHAHAGRPGAQGGPHPAAGTCRPAPGLLGTALWRASRRAAPPNHEARSRPMRPVPRAAGEPASRAPASCLPVGDANRARGAAGAVGEVAGAKSARRQPRSIATKASGWRHGGGPTPQPLHERQLRHSLGKDAGGPTATAQGHWVRPCLPSPGRRVHVHHVGDVPPGGGQLAQPASQPQEISSSAKVTLQPTDTAGSSRVPRGTGTVAGIGVSPIIITVARGGLIYSPTQLRVGTNVL